MAGDSSARHGRADPVPPLMLIHGLADDNVVVAHTLRLSGALLAAGYPHTVLPLSGITHMASQETVAENLLLLQLDFLRDALSGSGPALHDRGSTYRRCRCIDPRSMVRDGRFSPSKANWPSAAKGRAARTASAFSGP